MARFLKTERLCSSTQIDALFRSGKSFGIYPIRVVVLKQASLQYLPIQILVSVSKRHFKKAVDRNTIKRRLREAYRLNKEILMNTANDRNYLPSKIAFLYISNELHSFHDIEQAVITSLKRMLDQSKSLNKQI